jgi:hypothetical protein
VGHARVDSGPATPDGLGELIMPFVPANVNVEGRWRNAEVTSDVYNIADRLKELNDRLRINITEDTATGQWAYSIVEDTPEGWQLVFRCRRLDARVVEHVRYLLKVPFAKRFDEAEKIVAKDAENAHNEELDALTENLGLPMIRDLERCGFLDGPRRQSFARTSVATGGRRIR